MRIFLTFILLCLTAMPARAEIEVPKRFFEDKTASLTIEDILALPPSTDWRAVTVSEPQFGEKFATYNAAGIDGHARGIGRT